MTSSYAAVGVSLEQSSEDDEAAQQQRVRNSGTEFGIFLSLPAPPSRIETETAEAEAAASALIALGYGLLRDERKYQSRDAEEHPQNRIPTRDVYHSDGSQQEDCQHQPLQVYPHAPEGLSRDVFKAALDRLAVVR